MVPALQPIATAVHHRRVTAAAAEGFSEADHDLYDAYDVRGATVAPMPAGSSMSLRDALGMMLIPSACNYAEAVPTWAFGSQWAFLRGPRTSRDGKRGTWGRGPTACCTRHSCPWAAGPHTVTTDIEIEGDIVPPTQWWRLTHPTELGG